MLVGIIGAMDLEVQALKGLMDNAVVETISTIDFYKGNINGVETVVAVAGVGKVNAAVCAQTMILKYSPDIMINVGVAGGLSDEFKIGDIAVADSVVEHDMDTSPIGDPVGLISGINLVNIPCDKKLADLMEQAVSKVGTITSKRGVIASGDQFISKQEQRDRSGRSLCRSIQQSNGSVRTDQRYLRHHLCPADKSLGIRFQQKRQYHARHNR